MLVANARMYSVEPATAAAWRTVFAWVANQASMPLEIVDHTGPIDALWRRPDLGCAFICGYPFATWDAQGGPRPLPLAAPVPRGSDGQPRYRTCIVTRADSAIRTLDDVRARRFAYTIAHSQSGYQAARRLFAERAPKNGGHYFERVVGPLVTPRRIVEAVLGDEADAGPLDSYWLDLLTQHEPHLARQLRVIATTPWTPAPLLVCSATVAEASRERIVGALLEAGSAQLLEQARDALALSGFVRADAATYAILADDAASTDARGYPILQ